MTTTVGLRPPSTPHAAAIAAPWSERRRRARELGRRESYAGDVLALYLALLDPQERAFEAAIAERPVPADIPAFVVARALPGVMEAVVARGTELLRETAILAFHEGRVEEMVRQWLACAALEPADLFLARAAASPVLEALPDVARATGQPSDERHCATCGGLPQLAFFANSGEALVSGARYLVCSRCADRWQYPRMTCAGCGEKDTARLPVYRASEILPHTRVDACESCRTYLITVEMAKDPAAVPLVDEIAALPLDIDAKERGFTKVTPNLMGF